MDKNKIHLNYILFEELNLSTYYNKEMRKKKNKKDPMHGDWTRRESNTQPSDLESDALPLRHGSSMFLPQTILYMIQLNTFKGPLLLREKLNIFKSHEGKLFLQRG